MRALASLRWQFNLCQNRLFICSNHAALLCSSGLQSRAAILQSSARKCFQLDHLLSVSVSVHSVATKVGRSYKKKKKTLAALEITHPAPSIHSRVLCSQLFSDENKNKNFRTPLLGPLMSCHCGCIVKTSCQLVIINKSINKKIYYLIQTYIYILMYVYICAFLCQVCSILSKTNKIKLNK